MAEGIDANEQLDIDEVARSLVAEQDAANQNNAVVNNSQGRAEELSRPCTYDWFLQEVRNFVGLYCKQFE